MNSSNKRDGEWLEILYTHFNKSGFLYPDPLVMALQFPRQEDREVAALISSLFALGRVDSILTFLRDLFDHFDSPCEQLQKLSAGEILEFCRGRVYRFFSPRRMASLLLAIGGVLRRFGSLEAASFPGEFGEFPALEAMARLRQNLLREAEDHSQHSAVLRDHGSTPSPGSEGILPGIVFPALVPPFRSGGAAKRLMLFLRWMVRKDDIDPGGWEILKPAQLVYPLDTHLMRISGQLNLRSRKSADLRTALEITRTMAAINPSDPVKYDFCLTRTGIHPRLQKLEIIIKFYNDTDGLRNYLDSLEGENENTDKS